MPSAPCWIASAASSPRLDPLDQHLHLRHVLDALDEVPGQRRRGQPDALHVDAGEHRLARGARAGARVHADPGGVVVARRAVARILRARRVPVSVLRPAGRSTVTATAAQPAASARFTSFVVIGEVRRGVELIPDRPAARLGDLLDALRRLRGDDLQLVLGLCGPRRRHFAVRMECAGAADGAHDDRRVERRAEQFDRRVDRADVDESPGLQLVAVVAVTIGLSVASPSTPLIRYPQCAGGTTFWAAVSKSKTSSAYCACSRSPAARPRRDRERGRATGWRRRTSGTRGGRKILLFTPRERGAVSTTPVQTVRADFPHTAYQGAFETQHYAASG